MGVCDRHTRDRIIDRCIAAGQLLRLLMELPGRRVNHRGCRADVLARVGTRLDSAFLLEVTLESHLPEKLLASGEEKH